MDIIIWYLLWTALVTFCAIRCHKAWIFYLLISTFFSPVVAGIILLLSCIIFGTDD
jgi:hypothetical protein